MKKRNMKQKLLTLSVTAIIAVLSAYAYATQSAHNGDTVFGAAGWSEIN